ncbi:MAG: MEDS domain-containing protein [Thermoproteota archaeon]|nr:MEDS domain-containing protein [Thermoproteota archaeon]
MKQQIEEKNDIVLINPFYETTDSVRKTLSDGKADVDVSKYEKEQSLVIIDSLKEYFGKRNDMIFKRNIAKHAKEKGKSGLFTLSDMGAYPFKGRKNDLIDHELSLPTTFENIAMKGFCLYHEKDFDRFSKEQRGKLIEHHGMAIKIKV